MIKREFTSCSICGQQIVLSTTGKCSNRCEVAGKTINELADMVQSLKPTMDRKVFFHNHTFGDLADLYTIQLLRRLHMTDLRQQQTADRRLNALERSVMTKANLFSYDQETKKLISKLITKLFTTNAQLFRLRSIAVNEQRPEETRIAAMQEYFRLLKIRDDDKRQMDILVDGFTDSTKVYDGQ